MGHANPPQVELASEGATLSDAFFAWLDEDFSTGLAVRREHGDWFALWMDFDITGTGVTPRDAIQQAGALLSAYLMSYFDDGRSFGDALRPVPRTLRYRIIAEASLARVVRAVTPRIEFASESTYELPPGSLRHCLT